MLLYSRIIGSKKIPDFTRMNLLVSLGWSELDPKRNLIQRRFLEVRQMLRSSIAIIQSDDNPKLPFSHTRWSSWCCFAISTA